MEAAFGFSTCLPGNDLPIEPEFSASRSELLRPLGRSEEIKPTRTAQITLTPASLQKETAKVLSVPAVTQIERPAIAALPAPPAIQKASVPEVLTDTNEAVTTPKVEQTGPYTIQLASYLSEERAQKAWNKLSTQNDSLSEFQPNIVAAQVPDKGLYFRLQVGSYESRPIAAQYCQTLKIEGLDCFVALNNGS